jgi:hypothetical protein
VLGDDFVAAMVDVPTLEVHGLCQGVEDRREVVNTSFNVRGEPIVCTPEDAYRCFMRTEIDYLVIENFVLDKREQPAWEHDDAWRDTLDLD